MSWSVHRRWAPEVVEWGEGPCPVTISLDKQDFVSYVCAYLPHAEHAAETWAKALNYVKNSLDTLKQKGRTHIVLAGDFNIGNLWDITDSVETRG